jgi:hypothetical protein
MDTIKGTLHRFTLENTQRGVRMSFKLEGDSMIHRGTFLTEDNEKMMHLLQKCGQGDDVEITTDAEGDVCNVTWKNTTCPMELQLKQPKVGDFDGMMYCDPGETLVFAKKTNNFSRFN